MGSHAENPYDSQTVAYTAREQNPSPHMSKGKPASNLPLGKPFRAIRRVPDPGARDDAGWNIGRFVHST